MRKSGKPYMGSLAYFQKEQAVRIKQMISDE
jgi:hypothetical protein